MIGLADRYLLPRGHPACSFAVPDRRRHPKLGYRETPMRFIQAVVFLVFLLVIGVFAVQNMGVVNVSFFTWNLAQPVALVIVVVYVLGMLSGWTVLAFMRGSLRRVTQRPGH
jgi:lipopolysaccharide assembly protein A